ncbi:hypothetical protein WAF17_08560 [Bernardetia sp. ABR2-2B]|uniref:hypothetical protein n=1 Tax=Bernardetia sp. ABR2-2B TaxID=3127472 RepID=UPI0030CA64B0
MKKFKKFRLSTKEASEIKGGEFYDTINGEGGGGQPSRQYCRSINKDHCYSPLSQRYYCC